MNETNMDWNESLNFRYEGIAARKEYQHADTSLITVLEEHPESIAETILQFMKEEQQAAKLRLRTRLLPILTQHCIRAAQTAECFEEDVSGTPPNTVENLNTLLDKVEENPHLVQEYIDDYLLQQTVPAQHLGQATTFAEWLGSLWETAPSIQTENPVPIETKHVNSPKLNPNALEIEASWAQEIEPLIHQQSFMSQG